METRVGNHSLIVSAIVWIWLRTEVVAKKLWGMAKNMGPMFPGKEEKDIEFPKARKVW